jgi:hypothetical protein
MVVGFIKHRSIRLGPENPSAIVMCPRAFVGAAHYIDPALRALAAIHGLPMPVAWA